MSTVLTYTKGQPSRRLFPEPLAGSESLFVKSEEGRGTTGRVSSYRHNLLNVNFRLTKKQSNVSSSNSSSRIKFLRRVKQEGLVIELGYPVYGSPTTVVTPSDKNKTDRKLRGSSSMIYRKKYYQSFQCLNKANRPADMSGSVVGSKLQHTQPAPTQGPPPPPPAPAHGGMSVNVSVNGVVENQSDYDILRQFLGENKGPYDCCSPYQDVMSFGSFHEQEPPSCGACPCGAKRQPLKASISIPGPAAAAAGGGGAKLAPSSNHQLSPLRSNVSEQSDGSIEYLDCKKFQSDGFQSRPFSSEAGRMGSVCSNTKQLYSSFNYDNGYNECEFADELNSPLTGPDYDIDFLLGHQGHAFQPCFSPTTYVDGFKSTKGSNAGPGPGPGETITTTTTNNNNNNNTNNNTINSVSSLDQDQMKTFEWLFVGKKCSCVHSDACPKVRGKPIKELPCCKCLMEVFMTVLDAKKASERCGMSPTTFKKRLRKIGIKTYPSRKIRCLFTCIQNKYQALKQANNELEKRRVHDDLAKCREELRNFKDKLENVLGGGKVPENLTLNFSGRFKKIRNRIHKTNYKRSTLLLKKKVEKLMSQKPLEAENL